MRQGPLLAALLTGALLLPGCVGIPGAEDAAPTAEGALTFTASACREFATGAYADRARVEALLPQGVRLEDPLGPFAAYAQPGKALVYLTVLHCAQGALEGPDGAARAPVTFQFAEVYTAVAPPEGSAASGALFEFSLHAEDAHASERFTSAGWPTGRVTAAHARAPVPGPGDLHATWSGAGFRYELNATYQNTTAGRFTPLTEVAYREVEGALRQSEWRLGAGTVAVTGTGRLSLSPGSFLADLLQAEEVDALVVTSTYETFQGSLPPPARTARPTV